MALSLLSDDVQARERTAGEIAKLKGIIGAITMRLGNTDYYIGNIDRREIELSLEAGVNVDFDKSGGAKVSVGMGS